VSQSKIATLKTDADADTDPAMKIYRFSCATGRATEAYRTDASLVKKMTTRKFQPHSRKFIDKYKLCEIYKYHQFD
jgi:hypothetical protein